MVYLAIDIAIGPFECVVADADAQRVFILRKRIFSPLTKRRTVTDATQSLDSVTSPGAVAVSDQNVLFC